MSRYYIPNDQDLPTEFKLLARRFRLDDQILGSAAGGGTGVIGGCEVSQHSPTAGMSVDIAGGQAVYEFDSFNVSSQTVAVPSADSSLPRYDLITVDTGGTGRCRSGTPNVSPVPLEVPDDEVALALALVPANETAIENGQIVDKAVLVPTPLATSPLVVVGASTDLTRTSTNVLANDPVLEVPMLANNTYRIRGTLYFLARLASDLKVGWNGPGAPSQIVGLYNYVANGVPSTTNFINGYNTSGVQIAIAAGLTTFTPTFNIDIMVRNGVTAGSFVMMWSQNSSVAENTTRFSASYLEYQRVV